jgi:hypothetical protein
MSTAMAVAGKGGGVVTVAPSKQSPGRENECLNEKCDFLHRKDFKIRN